MMIVMKPNATQEEIEHVLARVRSVGARAHEPPYPHQAAGGEFEQGMVLAVEPGVYWPGGGGLRVEDNFLVTSDGVEKLSSFPDGVVQAG